MITGNVTDRYADDANYVAGRYLDLCDDDGNTYPLVGAFARGYATAMLWANTYREFQDENGNWEIEPAQDVTYAYISPGEWWNDIGIDFSDAVDFLSDNLHTLSAIADQEADKSENRYLTADSVAWSVFEQHGHDFALTRNHHGAGFWDRGYGDMGDTLTEAAQTYGEAHLIVSADDDDFTIISE